MKDEVIRLLELANKTKDMSFNIDPLQGKYYYTSLSSKDGIIKLSVNSNEPSERELENGWNRDDDGMDHVETDKSYNLALFISQCSPDVVANLCQSYLEAMKEIESLNSSLEYYVKEIKLLEESEKIASDTVYKLLRG